MKRIYIIICIAAAALYMPYMLNAQPAGLSLDECLSRALSAGTASRNAALDVKAALAQKQEAVAEYFPSVSVNALGFYAIDPMLRLGVDDVLGSSDVENNIKNYLHTIAPLYGFETEYRDMQYGYGAMVTLTQPVYAGGRIVNGNRLASLGVEAAQLQESLQRKLSAEEVEQKYWLVVSLEEKAATLAAAMEMVDSLLKDVASLKAAGILTDRELLQVKLRQSELKKTALQLKGGTRLARMDLFNAIGLEYAVTTAGVQDLPFVDDILLTDRLDSLPSPQSCYVPEEELAARTEESRLLELQVRAKALEKKMAAGEALPTVGVGAGYGYSRYIGDGGFNGMVYAMVKIPVTDWGKVSRRMQRIGYQEEKARNDRDYLNAQLVLRARKDWVELNTAWEQIAVGEEAVAFASEELRHAQSSFDAGLSTLSELLQAETALRQSRDELTGYRIDYRKALVEYLK